jgi:hypothetical protein
MTGRCCKICSLCPRVHTVCYTLSTQSSLPGGKSAGADVCGAKSVSPFCVHGTMFNGGQTQL